MIGMESQIFTPFRALGYVTNHVPFHISVKGSNHFVTAAIGSSFHEYNCSKLDLVFVGEQLESDVNCLVSTKNFTIVASKNSIHLFHRGKKAKLYCGHEHEVCFLLAIGNIIVSCDLSNHINVWSEETLETYTTLELNQEIFKVSAVVHPSTYLNKILLGSKQGALKIWNIKTNKIIYEIKGWNNEVTVLKQAPAVDVIAIGLQNGHIYIHNIKVDKTLMKLFQEFGQVTTLSFRTDGVPIMTAGSNEGHISFWDLEKKRLISTQSRAHDGSITSIEFLQKQPLLLSSGPDNSLKIWIFDNPDGSGRLLKSRCGHSAPPTKSLFFGSYGNVILTTGMDKSLRHTSIMRGIQCNEFSQGSVVSKANRKGISAELLKLPPVTCIAAETSRQFDWDNIVTCHLGLPYAYTWTSDKRSIGKYKLFNNKDIAATAVDISSCGNYCVVGYKNGSLEKYNLQSGIHRGTFGKKKKCATHKQAVRGISIDLANYMAVSSSSDSTIKFWNFKDQYLIHTVQCHCPVANSKLHRDSSLLAVSFDDFTLYIYDIDTKRMVRKFNGHSNTITDFSWSADGRWLISSSIDGTIKTWDVPSARLIDCFVIDDPATSICLSPTSEFLTTTHQDNVGIYLWSNKVAYTGIHPTPLPNDYEPIALGLPTTQIEVGESEDSSKVDEIVEEDKETTYNSPDQLGDFLITLSMLPESRWKSLTCIDLIKERNKPKQPPKKPEAAPFFLPTISGIETKFDIAKKNDDEENIDRFIKPKNLEMSSEFHQIVNDSSKSEEQVTEFMDKLKKFSPSEADLEIRTLSPEAGGNNELMVNFIRLLVIILQTGENYELIQAYIALFIKIHGDYIRRQDTLLEEAQILLNCSQQTFLKTEELINQSICLVRYFKSATI